MQRILITGGAGFIGSHFAKKMVNLGHKPLIIDKLTYAANLNNLKEIKGKYQFYQLDINDSKKILEILQKNSIDWVVNFAAESHVDNSINSPDEFIKTNINGTFNLLKSCHQHFQSLDTLKKDAFRFIHISTDEIYGSLNESEPSFNENSPYRPNSPYSASKAASDHLVRSWYKTYGFPSIITNCSNNFGPNQHSEKLIPTTINSCLNNQKIPIYGNGKNIRDWIHIYDHCDGIYLTLIQGTIGESYCFGGEYEIANIDLVKKICKIIDDLKPNKNSSSYENLISFINDRKGHDFRYSISNNKVKKELNFEIKGSFDQKLKETIKFYL